MRRRIYKGELHGNAPPGRCGDGGDQGNFPVEDKEQTLGSSELFSGIWAPE